MQISFVTSNINKLKEFKAILGDEIKIKHIAMSYRELRSDDPEEIAKESAERLANELKKSVVVEDSGLFIKELKDFPGTCSAYIHKRIGLHGILRLMEDKKDRTCVYKSAVAYCEPGKEPVSFLGIEKGKISKEIKGTYGFGHDSIFIPEGSRKTYGQIKNCESIKKFRKTAVIELKGHLLGR